MVIISQSAKLSKATVCSAIRSLERKGIIQIGPYSKYILVETPKHDSDITFTEDDALAFANSIAKQVCSEEISLVYISEIIRKISQRSTKSE